MSEIFLKRHPRIIQGGMGIAVSDWRLARAVSRLGELGVISGTAIDTVMVRRLQDGDPGGHVRRALAAFPVPDVADDILRRYFVEGGREAGVPYRLLPMYRKNVAHARDCITMVANFVEVWLAKEGHDGVVGINLLAKVQMPTLPSLFGAMLARVDYVLMGAGIPREIPGALDAMAELRPARIKFDVDGDAPGVVEELSFDPRRFVRDLPVQLRRPFFLPIISAVSLAATLARKANGRVDGFVVEGHTAGGHNAPPRGEPRFSSAGEPIYGERDLVDLAKMRELGLPFWVAGGVGSPESLRAVLAQGATGVQVGTLFAYCDESGLAEPIRHAVLAALPDRLVSLRTDPRASPTRYPFKLVNVPGLAQQDDKRTRNCDLGYLRTAYRRPDGRLGYRCAAEPVEDYVAKGGDIADTVDRRCLCNGLTANVGQPQVRDEGDELPLLTSGDELVSLTSFARGRSSYSAADVVQHLRGHAMNDRKR